MSALNEELEKLKKRNVELAKALEESKLTTAQSDRERMNLVRERNELKLKLNRIRSGGAAQMRQLDVALQAAIQETLTHLVQASNAVARTMELAKTYIRDRQELDASSPRWSRLSGTPVGAERERVNRVPPLLIGGQSIQPVVSLSRTLLNSSTSSGNRSPNQQNHNVTERAVPMHILQDVYIPLTRIDAAMIGNQEEDEATNIENSTEDIGLEDNAEEELEELQNVNDAGFRSPQSLEPVIEEEEPEGDQTPSPNASGNCTDNPLEGPSWLLDVYHDTQTSRAQSCLTPEPDSTTEMQDTERSASTSVIQKQQASEMSPVVEGAGGAGGAAAGGAFTPTVRRRRRSSSPHQAPHQAPPRRNSINKRVLKVVVAKMKFDNEEEQSSSPPKKMKVHSSPRPSPILQPVHQKPEQAEIDVLSPILQMKVRSKMAMDSARDMTRFDAPSPNGATDARVIIVSETDASESTESLQPALRRKSARQVPEDDTDVARTDTNNARDTSASRRDTSASRRDTSASRRDTTASRRNTSVSRRDTDETRDNSRSVTPESDTCVERQEGRSRRTRKQVVYREKPLNRKLRR